MSIKQLGGSRQREMFARSTEPTISIRPDHRLAILERELDWTELIERAQKVRYAKLKNKAGRPPNLRALVGALLLGAGRRMSYREAEDQIRYYAPARLFCGLTETDWTPDHNTIHDFDVLMGEEGNRLFNEYAVQLAVEKNLADPSLQVADTTAQEAAIPHPNEMGMMAAFLSAVGTASQKAGATMKEFAAKIDGKLKAAKKSIREYRLFAKTKEAKTKLLRKMTAMVNDIQEALGKTLDLEKARERVKGYAKVASSRLISLHETMSKLLPQIRYWLRTGKVASGKIISLHIPQLYSIVRGKIGKEVEFGLKWGISRIKGGFIRLTMAKERFDLHDSQFAVHAVEEHKAFFGEAPKFYAYDRGGYSEENIYSLKQLGVEEVGLAPRGNAKWRVSGTVKEKLVNERAQVEGAIGAIKNIRYGFNRPSARSVEMMGARGQRAALGFNLNKLVRGLVNQKRWEMVG